MAEVFSGKIKTEGMYIHAGDYYNQDFLSVEVIAPICLLSFNAIKFEILL
jgi:hypothetical protein